MKRRTAVLFALTVLVAAPACGRGGPSPEEVSAQRHELVLASARKAAEVKTAHFEFNASVPAPSGRTAELRGTGAVDNSVPLISMVMDTAGLVPGAPADAKLSFIYDGKAFYMRFPDSQAAQLGGKHWIRFDPRTLPPEAGVDFDALLAQFRSSDPLANMSLLFGAADDVEEVGNQMVRGVATRHFEVTVDVRKSVEQAPAGVRDSMAKLAEGLGAETLPAEVWIDGEGLPRRLVYEVDLAKVSRSGAGGAQGILRTSMELFDYGKPVGVGPPDEKDTVDVGQLAGKRGGRR